VTDVPKRAAIVGSGPNGLAAAITLARAGWRVAVFERATVAGGSLRSETISNPGFLHDVCSSVFPLGVASPFFRSVPLDALGVRWLHPRLPLAHPFDDGTATILAGSLDETAARLGPDGSAWRALLSDPVQRWTAVLDGVLGPPRVSAVSTLFPRFGFTPLLSARRVATARFRHDRTRALFAGLAAHSTLPLTATASSAVGLVLAAAAHATGWPFVEGGAGRLTAGLVDHPRSLGGEIALGHRVDSLDEFDRGETVLLDVGPHAFADLAATRLSSRALAPFRGFRYGPGVFKIDWALSRAIPWTAADCREAGTIHVGGAFEEIVAAEAAPWKGLEAERPFVILTQPSVADASRAPGGKHVAWGYCHVPNGSRADMTERIEQQIERFAPGFSSSILARLVTTPAGFEARNANLVGGDISGGAMDLRQLVLRPTWPPYRTPLDGVLLCSASTPPGGGVHGMCGYHAARVVMRTKR